MLKESFLHEIENLLSQGKEVLIVCGSEETKLQTIEQTKHLAGKIEIKTIDHKNTFKGKSDPGCFVEDTAPMRADLYAILQKDFSIQEI